MARDGSSGGADSLTTSDVAVRQLEKAARVAAGAGGETAASPDPAQDPDFSEVVSVGKAGEGAPEEDAADISDASGAGPVRPAGGDAGVA